MHRDLHNRRVHSDAFDGLHKSSDIVLSVPTPAGSFESNTPPDHGQPSGFKDHSAQHYGESPSLDFPHSLPLKTLGFFQRHPNLIYLLVVSFATRFWRLHYPKEIVFDEVHFGYFAGSYIKGEHYFDIHPPLSKLILAFFGWLGGYDGHFDFDSNQPYDGDWYMSLRFMPAFCGSLHAPLAYMTMKEMRASEAACVLVSVAVIVDMCLLLEARIIVTDALLMLFVIGAFYFYVRTKNSNTFSNRWFFSMFFCGVFIGGCISSKWTALATMGIIGADYGAWLISRWKSQNLDDRILAWASGALLLFFVPVCIYIFSWVLHIYFLPKSGKGDPWMSHEFRKRLEGNEEPEHIEPEGLFSSIIEFQIKLYVNNKAIVDPHHWMTSWWSWPVLIRGLAFWGGREADDPPNTRRSIYLLGNPLVWWTATATLIFYICFVFYIPYRKTPMNQYEKRYIKIGALLLGGYMFNWLPFILIARVTFLYHYMPSLYFSILLVGHSLDSLFPTSYPNRIRVFLFVGFVYVATFIYHSPLVYAFPITQAQRDARKWFPLWT